jgi:DHA1 family inner membrane transport protein
MNDPLPPGRRRLALAALTLGGFAMGISQFTVGGCLPDMARDLLPDSRATDPDGAIGSTGWVVTAFTLGAVAGAPLVAATTGRLARKHLLLGLVAVFVISSVMVAVSPTFGMVVAASFVNGIPFGVYVSTAILVASSLMPADQRGRGVGIVTVGAPLAALIGAPVATAAGQLFGWRIVFVLIAGVFALAFAAIAVAVPRQPGNPGAGIRAEAAALRLPQVWLAIAFGVLGFGGMFAVITYIAPTATTVTGLPANAVPLVHVALGLGLTVGSLAGGWLVDRSVPRALLGFVIGMTLAVAGFGLFAHTVVGLLVFTALIGFFNAGSRGRHPGPHDRHRKNSQALGAALNQSALSLGHSTGSFLGGAAIAYGLGYQAPAVVGTVISAVGVIIVVVALSLERANRHSHVPPATRSATSPARSVLSK